MSQDAVRRRIVVRMQDGEIIKGFLRPVPRESMVEALRKSGDTFPASAQLERQDGSPIAVNWSNVKALFFVKTFEGDREREHLRFHTDGLEVGSLWVEMEFRDGELLEGFIHNSLHHLVEAGFFLSPSDLQSNDDLIYVNKSALANYRVLGVRKLVGFE